MTKHSAKAVDLMLPTAGRLGSLTENETQTLEIFTSSISQRPFFDPIRHTPHLCLKFLRARKFNLEESLSMLEKCEAWRLENNVSALISFTLNAEAKEALFLINPKYYHKTDCRGRPVYYECLTKLSQEALDSVADTESLFKNHIASYEVLNRIRLPACSAAAGRHIEDICIVVDLKGLSSMKAMSMLNLMNKITSVSKDFYPEGMFKCFVINMPMLLRGLYQTFVAPLLDPATRAKTEVMGSGYASVLLQYIPKENLPAYYGGGCQCEGGCDRSDEGPWKAHFSEEAK